MSYHLFWGIWIALALVAGVGLGLILRRQPVEPEEEIIHLGTERAETAMALDEEPVSIGTRSVNVWLENWRATGSQVRVDQYELDVRLEWTKTDGSDGSWEGVVTFPNDLALVPTAWLKEELTDLLLRAARHRLSVL